MKIWLRIAVIFYTALMLVACGGNKINGNGNIVTKKRTVQPFQQLNVSGAYEIKLVQGSSDSIKPDSINITTDSNVSPWIITQVKNNVLTIRNKRGVSLNLQRPVLIKIVTKALNRIRASGSNRFIINKIYAKRLVFITSGSMQADFSGQVTQLILQLSGNNQVDASKLMAKAVNVRLIGSGKVMVHATNTLKATITGSGHIMYYGKPKNLSQSISGSGILEHVKSIRQSLNQHQSA